MQWSGCGLVSGEICGLEGGDGVQECISEREEVMVLVEYRVVCGGENGASTCALCGFNYALI